VTDEYVSLPVPVRLLPRVAVALDEYRTKPRRHPDPDSHDLVVLAAAARALFLPDTRQDASGHAMTRHGADAVVGGGLTADETLLSLESVGRRLDVSLRTVQRLVQGDDLPTVMVGARRRVRLDALQTWLDQRTEV
jgi:excisionase family DNA binding protein